MLENLVKLVKEFAGDAVVNNPDIPNEHNDNVVAETTNTVAGGLQNMISGGGLQNILSMFKGGGQQGGLMNNPLVNMMIGHLTGKLTNKYGIDSNKAGNLASGLIPNVLSHLINRTNDPNNKSFDLNSIIGSLTGGGTAATAGDPGTAAPGGGFNLESLLNKVTGGSLDTNQDGKVGFEDIISKFTGGARNAQQQAGGGGLMDMIKGFMK